jgi:hypothetical protein
MMNEMLMQMITARAGASGNLALVDMLARMRSSPDAISNLNIEELLAQQGQTNPMAAMLAKHLAERKASNSLREQARVIDVEASEVDTKLPTEETHNQWEDSAASLAELRQHLNGMLSEMKLLRDRNDALAAAVGACCLCWGESLECRSCRGRGGPGFCMPDETLFVEFVLPAVQTLRAQRAKVKSSSPQVQGKAASA